MNKKLLSGIIIILSLGLAIYGYIVLPEQVVVQIDFHGDPSNFYPKILSIALETVLTIGGALGYYFSKYKEKKYLFLSVVGLAVTIITLIYNTWLFLGGHRGDTRLRLYLSSLAWLVNVPLPSHWGHSPPQARVCPL